MQLPWSRRLGFPGAVPVGNADPRSLFTVDVEEYFQVSAFERTVALDQWASLPSRLEGQMEELLSLLAEHGAKGTFFVVGWIAERYPGIVRRIRADGHEIASHGFYHLRVSSEGAKDFRREVRDSKRILEEITGQAVLGYRSPSFSITPGCEWAFDVLLEEGYRYDSSLFPIHRPGYGHPGALAEPFWITRLAGSILELPLTTLKFAGVRLPAAGGAYFRHFPYAFNRRALAGSSARMFYIHPWELDVGQPRLPVSRLTARRHYGGLEHTVPRLKRLLVDFRFTSIDEAFELRKDGKVPETRAATVSP